MIGICYCIHLLANVGRSAQQTHRRGTRPSVAALRAQRTERFGQRRANALAGHNHQREHPEHDRAGAGTVRGQRRSSRTAFSGKLSLQEAVRRGLEYNLGAVGLSNAVRQAQRAGARGAQFAHAESERGLA